MKLPWKHFFTQQDMSEIPSRHCMITAQIFYFGNKVKKYRKLTTLLGNRVWLVAHPWTTVFSIMADFINVNADTTFEPWELCKDQRDLPVSGWGCLISQGLAGNQKPF